MSTQSIEHEIADLKHRVGTLEQQVASPKHGGWETIAGKAKDDDLLEEAMRLGAEWRARVNANGE